MIVSKCRTQNQSMSEEKRPSAAPVQMREAVLKQGNSFVSSMTLLLRLSTIITLQMINYLFSSTDRLSLRSTNHQSATTMLHHTRSLMVTVLLIECAPTLARHWQCLVTCLCNVIVNCNCYKKDSITINTPDVSANIVPETSPKAQCKYRSINATKAFTATNTRFRLDCVSRSMLT